MRQRCLALGQGCVLRAPTLLRFRWVLTDQTELRFTLRNRPHLSNNAIDLGLFLQLVRLDQGNFLVRGHKKCRVCLRQAAFEFFAKTDQFDSLSISPSTVTVPLVAVVTMPKNFEISTEFALET